MNEMRNRKGFSVLCYWQGVNDVALLSLWIADLAATEREIHEISSLERFWYSCRRWASSSAQSPLNFASRSEAVLCNNVNTDDDDDDVGDESP